MRFRDPGKADPRMYADKLQDLHRLPKEEVMCPLCAGPRPSRSLGEKLGFQIVQCNDCGHIYVSPWLEPRAVKCVYDMSYWDALQLFVGSPRLKERVDFDYSNALAKLRRDVLPYMQGGRLLDVGCANGALVKRAEELGFRAMGLEVSEEVADFARRTFGIEVIAGTLDEANLSPESFDCITMYDLVEHLINPRTYLREAFRLLRPRGLLVVETLNTDSLNSQEQGLDWHYIMPVEHIHYFSELGLLKLLRDVGFSIAASWCPHEDNVVVIAKKA